MRVFYGYRYNLSISGNIWWSTDIALEYLQRWKKNNDIVLYSVNFDRELYEDYDLDIEVRKINIPYKNKLMNFPLLMQQRIASKYISEHEIFNSHMFPCRSLNLENNIWIPQEPARILYDLKYLIDGEGFSKKALYNVSTHS